MIDSMFYDRPCSELSRHCKPFAHDQKQVGNPFGLWYEHLNAVAAVTDDEQHLVPVGEFIQALERLCVARLVKSDACPTIAKNVEADLCIDGGQTIALLHYQEIAQLIGVVRMVFSTNARSSGSAMLAVPSGSRMICMEFLSGIKKPTTLSDDRHWIADKKKNGTQDRQPGVCLPMTTRIEALLTDDRENFGCRYSRDRRGSGVRSIEGDPFLQRFRFLFAHKMLPTELIVLGEMEWLCPAPLQRKCVQCQGNCNQDHSVE